MAEKIFLSHDHRDRQIAKVMARLLSRITLQQLEVWFSSDASPTGGVQVGSVWLDTIRTELCSCKAILTLLTPNSVARPWLLFESGFGAAMPECEVIPISVGIDSLRDIPFPLAMYQCYQLSDYESLRNFLERVLSRYGVVFDEELAQNMLTAAISELASHLRSLKKQDAKPAITLKDVSLEIRDHIDRRLLELSGRLEGERRVDGREDPALYSVPMDLKIPNREMRHYVSIHQSTLVQDVMDNIYFILQPEVAPFKYLETWIMREVKSEKLLVIREVSDWVPARFVFRPESVWEAVPLEEPYKPEKSSDTDRWYYHDIPAV